jgi:hypothetical protein
MGFPVDAGTACFVDDRALEMRTREKGRKEQRDIEDRNAALNRGLAL